MSDPYAAFKDADPYAQFSDAPGKPAAKPSASSQPETFSDYAKDLGSAAIRPVVKAVTGLPGMAADATTAAWNIASGHVPLRINGHLNWTGQADSGAMQLPSQARDQLLDQYTRTPTGVGKAAEFFNTALLSSRLPTPQAANQAPPGFTSAAQASELTPAQQQAAAAGAGLGMKQLPGQQTGSKALQQFEAKLESQPWTSGPINAVKANNQTVLNRTAAASIGEHANVVDSDVLARANDRLGSIFENVRNPSRITIVDPQKTTGVIDGIDKDLEGLLPGNGSIRDNKLVQNLETLAQKGGINGQQLGQLSSKLGKAAYKQMSGPNGDRDLGQGLYAVKDHVDDLIQSGLSGDEQTSYAAARQQYRSLMQLTSRVGITNPSTGNVSGVGLASKLQQSDRPGFLYGRNQSDLYNAARFAQAFKPVVGDSGTATRSLGLNDLMSAHYGIPLNVLSRLYVSQPGQALARGAVKNGGLPGLLSNPSLARPVIGGLLAMQ